MISTFVSLISNEYFHWNHNTYKYTPDFFSSASNTECYNHVFLPTGIDYF